MELTVEHLGAVQFEVRTRDHVLISDQPEANGGFDEGPTPVDFLLAALGSCAAYYAVEYLKKNQLRETGAKVYVTAEKLKQPARLDNFRLRIEPAGEISPEHEEGMRRAVERCVIHNTLLHTPRITTEVVSKVSMLEAGAIGNQ